MDVNVIKKIIEGNGYEVSYVKPYKKNCHRIKLKLGTSVVCNDNGNVSVSGKLKKPLEKLLYDRKNEWEYNDKVFVVYGHDLSAKRELVEMLQGLGVTPLYIDNLPTQGRTIIEQLEYYIPKVCFGVVLLTPDDEGRCKDEKKLNNRARQNVIFEWGMLYSKVGRDRVLVISKEDDKLEYPSDVRDVMQARYINKVNEVSERLRKELKKYDYKLN